MLSNQDQMGRGREWEALWAGGTAYAKLCERGAGELAGTQGWKGRKACGQRGRTLMAGAFKTVGKPGGDFKVAAWYGRLCLNQTRSMFISYLDRQTDGQSHTVF